jgi:hypothetical protein
MGFIEISLVGRIEPIEDRNSAEVQESLLSEGICLTISDLYSRLTDEQSCTAAISTSASLLKRLSRTFYLPDG